MPSPRVTETKPTPAPLVGVVIALIGIAIVPAHARVGVTSQTDGDPLGRPPSQAERVLRVGIDIQANEVITTKSNDRAHVVFLDGTSLTVAPNAQLVIDKFVYDVDTKKGDIVISASKGVFRLVGGRISKANPMVVNTPSSTVGIRGGIGMLVVDADETKAFFLFGNSLTVTANGRVEKATRPGSLISTRRGGPPGTAVLVPSGSLAQVLAAFEANGDGKDGAADKKAKESGFSSGNSDRGLPVGEGAANPAGLSDQALQALTNADLGKPTSGVSGAPSVAAMPTTTTLGPTSIPPSGPVTLPVPGPSAGPVPGPSPTTPSPGTSPGQLPSPTHRATPAIGVGNGGLVPAIPASPRRN
jgi:hypothetical protein